MTNLLPEQLADEQQDGPHCLYCQDAGCPQCDDDLYYEREEDIAYWHEDHRTVSDD